MPHLQPGLGARLRARALCTSTRPPRLVQITAPPQAAITGAHSLWANLLGLHRPWHRRLLHGQAHVTFEYLFGEDGMSMRMWVPAEVSPGLVEHAIEAAWPGARATVTDLARLGPADAERLAAPLASHKAVAEGGRLVQQRSDAVPVRTKFDGDPHRALFGAVAALSPGEGACVQILARPASPRRVRACRRGINRLPGRRGSAAGIAGFGLGVIRQVLDFASPASFARGLDARHESAAAREQSHTLALVRDPRTEADARAAAGKLAGPQWECVIRYAAFVPANTDAVGRARGLSHAVGSAWSVFAERNYYRRRRLRRPVEVLAARAFRSGFLAHRGGRLHSLDELAAIAHLPCDLVVPGLARAGARPVAPSVRIPTGRDGAVVKILGDADCGPARPIALPVADSRHHLHVIGKTGVGKSTLLATIALGDIEAQRGTVVIDPKGDLIDDILARLPRGAEDRLVLIDPEAAGDPPRLNVLDGADPDTAVDNLVATFRRIYHASWGPRTDDLLRAATLTLLYAAREKKTNPARRSSEVQPDPTLAHVLALISRRELREKYLAMLSGDRYTVLHAFWSWYGALSEAGAAAVSAPLLNKLRAVLLREFPRRVLAAGPSDIDLEAVLGGGILLVRLPKGAIGEESTRLLGSLLVSRLWQALCARSRRGRERPDCTLIMDEFQNFLHQAVSAGDMLAEARGHGLSIIAAHQDLDQLGPELREAVSANARSKVYFNVSPEDARLLERHTLPHLSAYDLSHLDAFQVAARLVVDAAEQPACTLATRPLPAPDPARGERVRGSGITHDEREAANL